LNGKRLNYLGIKSKKPISLAMKQLDRIDHRILEILQQDAKSTIKEIAGQLGMTTTPVYERIKRMEEDGYIQHYVALLDRKLLGYDTVAFCTLSLKEHAQPYLKKFEEDVKTLDEVVECYHIAGMYDYLLKVIVKDMEDYQRFIIDKLAALENIGNVQSSFIMQEIKHSTALAFRR
jgi:Lrp/AsnC family transcriptional regulator, leucine-responsive regulatory protein